MIAIKLNYTSEIPLDNILKEGNKIVRIAYSLFKRGYSLKIVERSIKTKYKYDDDILDSSLIRSFCIDAQALYKSSESVNGKTLIFGSRKSWKEYNNGKISKDEWKKIRNTRSLLFVGDSDRIFGNRKFDLDIENNIIKFKLNRKTHYSLNISGIGRRYNDLLKIQMLAEGKNCPITYRLSDKHIYINFDEKFLAKKELKFIKDRVAGLDLNPNYIGFVICDGEEKIVYKEIINLTKLNKTHDYKKKDFEIYQISKRLSKLCEHYMVEIVGYEDINIKTKDHGRGKRYNRLCNNDWNRNTFISNFKKRLNILGIKNQNIKAEYSSTIGQLNFPDETDIIAAALEISRRCFYFKRRFLDKDQNFIDKGITYPEFNYNKILERWNSKLSGYNVKNKGWKSIHNYLYKSKSKPIRFRFLYENYNFNSWSSFRFKSNRSFVMIDSFNLKQSRRPFTTFLVS